MDMDHPHALPPEKVLAHFNVSQTEGLSKRQVEEARAKYGPNSLPDDPPTPLWRLVLDQFKDQLVIILLVSAGISFLLALFEDTPDWTPFVDPAVILTILILNAIVGVSQESSAESAIAALQEYSANEAKVLRRHGDGDGPGSLSRIKADALVPGDILALAVGDRVPADARLLSIHTNSFRVDQAILTGESHSVNKSPHVVPDEAAVKQDQTNMLFSGTTVVAGQATAVVVATGSRTAIGDIHDSITAQIEAPTPLKEKLNDFGDMLAKVITAICVLVWAINVQHFNDPAHGGSWAKGAIYYLKIAVSLGVAAIPEGLAVVITTCLALGTRKMARKNAVVRDLPSVETLGSCSVVCSDKTGTLTTNQMSAERILYLAEAGDVLETVRVEGTTFAPVGRLLDAQGHELTDVAASSATLRALTETLALCNASSLQYDAKTNSFSIIGEPTEGALRVLVEKIGTDSAPVNEKLRDLPPQDRMHVASKHFEAKLPLQARYEFSRDRKSMSVLVNEGTAGSEKLLVKGAPESILDRCTHVLAGTDGRRLPLTPERKDAVLAQVAAYADQGNRIIAAAYVPVSEMTPDRRALLPHATTSKEYERLEQDLTFVALVGMLDPPRPEVPASIKACRDAGIRVVVITGDNKNTAEAICRQIGVFDPEEKDLTGLSFTGREFDALDEAAQAEAARTAKLFSRVEPAHKSKLVDLLQSAGHTVAMTGDGVNDAPALKKADIGVAMGSGTDVAKLAAAMVLTDDNFATIRVAIEEGRAIFSNTQQFIRYLISSNIGEVVSIFLTAALGMPEALVPVQLLWVNLVTDGLPATALSFNPPDKDVMRRPPRGRNEPLVSGWLFFRYMVIGTYVGVATVGGYAWWFMFYEHGPQISFWQLTHFHQCATTFPSTVDCGIFSGHSFAARSASTVSLSILVVIEMLNAANALSSSASLLTFPIWRNCYLVAAIALSMALHFAIVYVPVLRELFQIEALTVAEWKAVLWVSVPVIFIDEVLKFVERRL